MVENFDKLNKLTYAWFFTGIILLFDSDDWYDLKHLLLIIWDALSEVGKKGTRIYL